MRISTVPSRGLPRRQAPLQRRWFALADARNEHYGGAARTLLRLLKESLRLVTTNLVIAETHALVLKRSGPEPARKFLDRLSKSSRIQEVYADADLELEALAILEQYHDRGFTYTDAVSCALMRQRKIDTAFAFDRHFATAGFIVTPEL
jgi:uncharacterized protein